MTNTQAQHFGQAVHLTMQYGDALENVHREFHDKLRTHLRSFLTDEQVDEYMRRIRCELFFSIHGTNYVQQLSDIVEALDNEIKNKGVNV